MLQHDNAQTHVERIFTQFLEAENITVLSWPVYLLDMSPTEHVWDALDCRIWQRVPGPANIQQLSTAWKSSGSTSHRPQSTTWSTLCQWGLLHCLRQMVVKLSGFRTPLFELSSWKRGAKTMFFFFIQCNIRSLSRSSSHTSPQSLSHSLSVSSFPLDFNWSLHTPITATRHRLI